MDEQHLQEMYRMVEQNNSILRGMRRSALLSGFLKLLFWAAIVAAIYLTWQSYIQPVANQASQTYQSAQSQMQAAQGELQATQKSLQGVQQAASSTQSFFGGFLKNLGL